MKLLAPLFLLFTQLACTQTVSVKKKIDIPNKISETSGIVYLDTKKEIVTFNDSGGKAELYVLKAKSGKLKRTIEVKKAKNHDWESITRDDKYIYVGDTGNNNGNRTNLVIYKIAIKDLKKEKVSAVKIHYKYQDQTNFSNNKHQTNFDCEAICYYNNKLYLFTKNWKDYKTNVYEIPNTEGRHVATKKYSFAINCLLTSMAFNPKNKTFIGTAYNRNYKSCLIRIKESDLTTQKFEKISLFDELGFANQVEAIAWKDKSNIYITREATDVKVNGKRYSHNQKLMQLVLH